MRPPTNNYLSCDNGLNVDICNVMSGKMIDVILKLLRPYFIFMLINPDLRNEFCFHYKPNNIEMPKMYRYSACRQMGRVSAG